MTEPIVVPPKKRGRPRGRREKEATHSITVPLNNRAWWLREILSLRLGISKRGVIHLSLIEMARAYVPETHGIDDTALPDLFERLKEQANVPILLGKKKGKKK